MGAVIKLGPLGTGEKLVERLAAAVLCVGVIAKV